MAKKTHKNKPKKIEPSFEPGSVVSGACMVVDEHGIAWWVDPQSMTIKRVEM